jgi:hypothetical protein
MYEVKWYEPNVLPGQNSHHLLVNVRRTVIAEENAGKLVEMHHLARGIERFENNFSDIFLENCTSHVIRVVETDKKALLIPPSGSPYGIIYRLPADGQERYQHVTRH